MLGKLERLGECSRIDRVDFEQGWILCDLQRHKPKFPSHLPTSTVPTGSNTSVPAHCFCSNTLCLIDCSRGPRRARLSSGSFLTISFP